MRIPLSDRDLSGVVEMVGKTMLTGCVLWATSAFAEVDLAAPVDAPPNTEQIMQQAADGDVAVPRVRKFVKPNRVLMKASVANLKVGSAFMDENQYKPGVVKLKSGLQYKVIKAGSGRKPDENDVVSCHYSGALLDETVFEKSEPGKPAVIKVAPLIPGLKEAIKLMPVGSKWEIYIPPELGFGSAGNPPKVGPDAVLVYQLELLGITPAASNKR